jgi:hypothetical protein
MNHLAYDSRHDKMLYISDDLLASSIRTWAFDCATRQLSEIATLTRPEDVGRLAYNEPLNVFMLIGGKCVSGMCQTGTGGNALLCGIWVFRLDSSAGLARELAPAPSAAIDLTGGSIKLSWTGVSAATGYHVYRCTANPYPRNFTRLLQTPLTDTFCTDATASPGTWYAYKVTAIRDGTEGRASRLLYTRPGRVLGVVASVEEPTRVSLSWERNPEPDLTGYNIYRASGAAIFNASGLGTGYVKLNPSPVASNEFMDAVDLSDGVARGYVVTAVNAFGNESGLSAAATTFPNPPDRVYAIPQLVSGTLKTRLGWQPPERQKIAGVNVYRGPSGAAARQNTGPSPASDTLLYFLLPSASGTTSYELSMAAFFVRAVNILGQEGFNSDQVSPTATDFGFGRLTPYETFHYSDYTDIEEEGGPGIRGVPGPEAFRACPNPFNASVVFRLSPLLFAGGVPDRTELVVTDCRGRVVHRLAGRALGRSGPTVSFSGRGLPSGLYLARLKAGGLLFQKKITLIK